VSVRLEKCRTDDPLSIFGLALPRTVTAEELRTLMTGFGLPEKTEYENDYPGISSKAKS
jgi:hypothetical protein